MYVWLALGVYLIWGIALAGRWNNELKNAGSKTLVYEDGYEKWELVFLAIAWPVFLIKSDWR